MLTSPHGIRDAQEGQSKPDVDSDECVILQATRSANRKQRQSPPPG